MTEAPDAGGDDDARRGRIRQGLTAWLFPPTDHERRLFRIIDRLPRVLVARAPAAEALDAGFDPGRCHDNAAAFERLSRGEFRAVVGWAYGAPCGDFITHSVVSNGTDWLCVTPSEDLDPYFEFVPDPKLVASTGRLWRAGRPVGVGIRRHPDATIAFAQSFLARLDAGEDLDLLIQDMLVMAERDSDS